MFGFGKPRSSALPVKQIIRNQRQTSQYHHLFLPRISLAVVAVATFSLAAGLLVTSRKLSALGSVVSHHTQSSVELQKDKPAQGVIISSHDATVVPGSKAAMNIEADAPVILHAASIDYDSGSAVQGTNAIVNIEDSAPTNAKPTASTGESSEIIMASPEGSFTADRRFHNTKKDNQESVQQLSQNSYPRIISFDGESNNSTDTFRGASYNETKKRVIELSKKEIKAQKRLKNSRDFSYRDPLYEGDCVPMQKWQETSFPNCNHIHELDFFGKTRTRQFKYFAQGGYNDIFWINEKDKSKDPELIMKILQYGTDYSDRNFDRVRRDGLILERLTKSPYVLDIYGFCGFDVLTPMAKGGTLTEKLYYWKRGKRKLSDEARLKLAMEVALGLAAVHDIDGEGLSAVAHGDLKGGQYLIMDGVAKLGDFNRGRFLRRNSTAPDTACTYTIGQNDAAFRSPEEYEYLPQTSAIDVWALGSVLYNILTGRDAWYNTDIKKAQKLIRKGKLPTIDGNIKNSTHPVDVALTKAIDMCYVFDPKKRAKAAEVASYLQKAYVEFSGVGRKGSSVLGLLKRPGGS